MPKVKPSCPACDSNDVAIIVFGYPSWETVEAADSGELRLGGCSVEQDDPEWHCNQCEYEW